MSGNCKILYYYNMYIYIIEISLFVTFSVLYLFAHTLVLVYFTVMLLSFRTDMPGQTVQIQIRLSGSTLFRSSLIRVYTVCHSVCIVWTHYSMIQPHSSNFRVISTNFLGVRMFRKFTVIILIAHT